MPGTAQVEHAENMGGTLRRLVAYFIRERGTLAAMLGVVTLGTLCGLWAPSLQSTAIDIISGEAEGVLPATAGLMLGAYLLYSAGSWFRGFSAPNSASAL